MTSPPSSFSTATEAARGSNGISFLFFQCGRVPFYLHKPFNVAVFMLPKQVPIWKLFNATKFKHQSDMWSMVNHLFAPQLKCADPEKICLWGFHLNWRYLFQVCQVHNQYYPFPQIINNCVSLFSHQIVKVESKHKYINFYLHENDFDFSKLFCICLYNIQYYEIIKS